MVQSSLKAVFIQIRYKKSSLSLEDVNIPNRFKRHESGDYDPSLQLDSIKGLLFIQNSRVVGLNANRTKCQPDKMPT